MDYYLISSTPTGMTPGTSGGQLYLHRPFQRTTRQATPASREPIGRTYFPPQHQEYQLHPRHPEVSQQQFFAQQQLLLFHQQRYFPQHQSRNQNFYLNVTQNMPAPMAHSTYRQQAMAKGSRQTHHLAVRFEELKTLPNSEICRIRIQELQEVRAYQEESYAHYAEKAQTQPNAAQYLSNLNNLVADTNNTFEMWYACIEENRQKLKFGMDKAKMDLELEQATVVTNKATVEQWLDHMARTFPRLDVSKWQYVDQWRDGEDEVLRAYWNEGVPPIEKGYVNFVEVARKQGFRIPLAVALRHTKKRKSEGEYEVLEMSTVAKRKKAAPRDPDPDYEEVKISKASAAKRSRGKNNGILDSFQARIPARARYPARRGAA